MTLFEALQTAKKRLKNSGIEDYESDAWLLLSHVLNLKKADYYVRQREEFPEEKRQKWEELLVKRQQRIPLQHLTKEQEFMGYLFEVNEHVLIPRQETELLVEEAVRRYVSGRILDLCTGSGCILISVLKQLTEAGRNGLEGIGSDLSKEALLMAEKNASLLNKEISDKKVSVSFLQGDLFENIRGKFGMILSNPPYIAREEINRLMPEVRDFEPRMALDGKEDGLYFYREILKKVPDVLKKNGTLLFEIGYDQGEALKSLMEEAGLSEIEIKKDYSGCDRIAVGKLL